MVVIEVKVIEVVSVTDFFATHRNYRKRLKLNELNQALKVKHVKLVQLKDINTEVGNNIY